MKSQPLKLLFLTSLALACYSRQELAHGADQAAENQPTFQAKMLRSEEQLPYKSTGDATVFEVDRRFDIERAVIKREGKTWPKRVMIRLHLKGLELFKAGTQNVAVEWSVTNSDKRPRASLQKGKAITELRPDSPEFGEVRIIPEVEETPEQEGCFEMVLPATLFEGNPAEIKVEWVDFFRG